MIAATVQLNCRQ